MEFQVYSGQEFSSFAQAAIRASGIRRPARARSANTAPAKNVADAPKRPQSAPAKELATKRATPPTRLNAPKAVPRSAPFLVLHGH